LSVYDRLLHAEWLRLAVLPVSIEGCIDSVEKMSILFAINTRRVWLLVFCIHPQVVKQSTINCEVKKAFKMWSRSTQPHGHHTTRTDCQPPDPDRDCVRD